MTTRSRAWILFWGPFWRIQRPLPGMTTRNKAWILFRGPFWRIKRPLPGMTTRNKAWILFWGPFWRIKRPLPGMTTRSRAWILFWGPFWKIKRPLPGMTTRKQTYLFVFVWAGWVQNMVLATNRVTMRAPEVKTPAFCVEMQPGSYGTPPRPPNPILWVFVCEVTENIIS